MFLFTVLSIAASCWLCNGDRVPNPLAEFHFLHQDCVADDAIFRDSTAADLLGGMRRDQDRTSCLRGNGVKAVPDAPQGKSALATVAGIQNMLPYFRGSEVSLEFWVRSQETSVSDTILMAVAGRDAVSSYSVRVEQRAVTSASRPGAMFINARNRDGGSIILQSARLAKDIYSHVVVDLRHLSPVFAGKTFAVLEENTTVNASHQMSWTDGSLSGSYDMTSWTPQHVLQFFTSAAKTENLNSENFWPGELLFFAMYNKTLSRPEVNANYRAGLPNSLPVVWPVSVRVNEDGQHSLWGRVGEPIVFYHDVPLEQVSVVQLPVFDVDDTADHPNFKKAAGAHNYSVAYITRLPAKGRLYAPVRDDSTGEGGQSVSNVSGWEAVTRAPWPVLIGLIPAGVVVNPMWELSDPLGVGGGLLAGYFIKYVPDRDEYSTNNSLYSDFEISATDSATGEPSFERATISMQVTSVNDAPVAAAGITTEAFAAVPHIITVFGSDVDSPIGRARVSRLPAKGKMYHVFPNQSVAFDSPIAAVPTLLWGTSVAYVYTGPQNDTLLGLEQYISLDDFEFEIIDSVSEDRAVDGLASLPATAKIYVKPVIYAVEKAIVTGFEATALTIPIFGTDLSESGRDLLVEIADTPLYGRLVDYITGAELKKGVVLSQSIHADRRGIYKQPVNVTYIGNPYYFSLPRSRVNGSMLMAARNDLFTYHIKTVDNSYSPVAAQSVAIRNRNHATEVYFSYPSAEINKFDIFQLGSKSAEQGPASIQLNGFTILDNDQDTNYMRLSILTMGGIIDLNPAYVGFLTFNGLTYCDNLEWSCKGSGVDDQKLHAVGTAFQIRNALNGLVFRSLLSDYIDIVNISIYDGAGGNCVSNRVLDNYTVQTGCHERTTSFSVHVHSAPYDFEDRDPELLTDQYFPIQFLFLAAFLCIICCSLCCCFRLCRRQKDKYIEAGIIAPAKIRRPPFPINLCSDCNVHPVSFSFVRKKTKRSRIDRDLESQVSLDDVNVQVEGQDGVPPCHWVRCEKTKNKR